MTRSRKPAAKPAAPAALKTTAAAKPDRADAIARHALGAPVTPEPVPPLAPDVPELTDAELVADCEAQRDTLLRDVWQLGSADLYRLAGVTETIERHAPRPPET